MSNSNIKKLTFPVTGMICVGCASSVENILNKMDGVTEAGVNFASNTVLVSYDSKNVSKEQLKSKMQRAGYDIIISEKNAKEEQEAQQDRAYKEVNSRTF